MIIDTHIHIGRFYDRYFSPSYVCGLMDKLYVDYYAVSSTTQCEEDYEGIVKELTDLITLAGDKVIPVMWITPYGLEGSIQWYLESDIKWKMLKIHPFLNKTAWRPDSELLNEVLDIARELMIPLLIHTGEEDCCSAALFEDTIKSNDDIRFILAHGRPVKAALEIVREYENAYVDTAFMPMEHIQFIVEQGLSGKLLWGTDLCIPNYFNPMTDLEKYYIDRLENLRKICTQSQFNDITFSNAVKILNLSEKSKILYNGNQCKYNK